MKPRLVSFFATFGVIAAIVGCTALEQRPSGQDAQNREDETVGAIS